MLFYLNFDDLVDKADFFDGQCSIHEFIFTLNLRLVLKTDSKVITGSIILSRIQVIP